MKRSLIKRLPLLLVPLVCCLGCNLIENGVQTLVVEPIQYCALGDEYRTHVNNEKLAQEAWTDFCGQNQGHQFSDAYSRGFSEGFTCYLDAGGTGAPPPLPPRSYWDKRTDRDASIDWFAGYRTGSGMAQRTGMRQAVVVPTKSCIYTGQVLVYPSVTCQSETPAAETVPTPLPAVPKPGGSSSEFPNVPNPLSTSQVPQQAPQQPSGRLLFRDQQVRPSDARFIGHSSDNDSFPQPAPQQQQQQSDPDTQNPLRRDQSSPQQAQAIDAVSAQFPSYVSPTATGRMGPGNGTSEPVSFLDIAPARWLDTSLPIPTFPNDISGYSHESR